MTEWAGGGQLFGASPLDDEGIRGIKSFHDGLEDDPIGRVEVAVDLARVDGVDDLAGDAHGGL